MTVEWRNELAGSFPLSDTVAPQATDADGVPVQCLPGLSGGEPDRDAAGLTGHTDKQGNQEDGVGNGTAN